MIFLFGFIIIKPCSPSRIMKSPLLHIFKAFFTPTIEGNSRLLVRIELWDVLPPYSDIIPKPYESYVNKTSAGLKASVTIIELEKFLIAPFGVFFFTSRLVSIILTT